MNYIPLNEFKKAWVFRHTDLPIDESDLNKIKLMSATRSANLWSSFISRENDHPDFFDKHDWAGKTETWQDEFNWEPLWEEGESLLPADIKEFLEWEANTTVYFCLSREEVIETTFDVFQRTWQNFMFLADGGLLLGKKRETVAQFMAEGIVKFGKRPKTI